METISANAMHLVIADYDYGFSYEDRYVKHTDSVPVIVTKLASTQEEYNVFKATQQQVQSAYVANKKLWEKRQKFTDAIEELHQALQGRINEAFAEVDCEKQLLAIYEHFFILAEHDHKVALRFFRDTQSEKDVEILEKLKPGAFAEHELHRATAPL